MEQPQSVRMLLRDVVSTMKVKLYNPVMNLIATYDSKYDVEEHYMICPAIVENVDEDNNAIEIRIV